MLLLWLLQTGALKDTIHRARRDIEAALSSHCDSARFHRILELPVAAFGPDVLPAVAFELLNELTNLRATPRSG